MTDPNADPILAKVKALTAERQRRKADRLKRGRETLYAAIAKAKAVNGEAPVGRGGARANAGRKPLYERSGVLVPMLDETTRHRVATAGPKQGAEFIRTALARLVADLAEDGELAAKIAAQMEHLDPNLWEVPPGHDRPALSQLPVTAPATLCASVKIHCGRQKLFRSISQMARVAVSREMERLRGTR